MNNDENQEAVKKGAPKWSTTPFRDYIEQVEYLFEFLELTRQGISVLQAMPKAVEALALAEGENRSSDSFPGSKYERTLNIAEKSADLAARELATGFPILHSQAVVTMWGYLEALIKVFIAKWLMNEPSAFQVPEIRRLKIKLGVYEQLQGYDRYEYIVELLEKEVAVGLRNGTTRFEEILKPFGLEGEIPKDAKRGIYELGQVRNVIVHRSGITDRQILSACPWLDLTAGEKIHVSPEMLGRYFEATMIYVTLLIFRVAEYFGVDMSDQRAELLASTPNSMKQNAS